jgi:hypothetical protein
VTVIKQYNVGTSQWETIVVGKQGPTGATGATGTAVLTGGASRAVLAAGAYLDGTNGLVLSGIAGNQASTPDSAAVSVTGDIDIKVKFTATNWNSLSSTIAARFSGTTQRSYAINLRGFGDLSFVWSTDGTFGTQLIATSGAHGITNGATKWVRFTMDVNDGAGNYITKFYVSDDGSTWTPLATGTTAGTTSIFDGTSPLEIGNAGLGSPTAGTIHRVIVQSAFDTADNTSSVVFDADFAAQTANALAFTESSTNAATVSVTTTRYSYGLPGVQWSTSNATQALVANTVYYQPFLVTAPTVVDMTSFRVTTGTAAGATNVRTGIYAADANMQPTGAPVLDSGNVVVATSATGNFYTSVTPVTLQPGMYLTAINSSRALTLQAARGGIVGADIGQGANAIFSTLLGTQTQGAFPNPGTSWNSRTFAATGPNHTLFLRWSPA